MPEARKRQSKKRGKFKGWSMRGAPPAGARAGAGHYSDAPKRPKKPRRTPAKVREQAQQAESAKPRTPEEARLDAALSGDIPDAEARARFIARFAGIEQTYEVMLDTDRAHTQRACRDRTLKLRAAARAMRKRVEAERVELQALRALDTGGTADAMAAAEAFAVKVTRSRGRRKQSLRGQDLLESHIERLSRRIVADGAGTARQLDAEAARIERKARKKARRGRPAEMAGYALASHVSSELDALGVEHGERLLRRVLAAFAPQLRAALGQAPSAEHARLVIDARSKRQGNSRSPKT